MRKLKLRDKSHSVPTTERVAWSDKHQCSEETVMKIESFLRHSLKCSVVLPALVLVLPTASLALPRQGATHQCGCVCDVQFSNGQWADLPENFKLPSQYACQSAEGMTCNVSDPASGGISQGTLRNCGDGSYGSGHVTIKPPVTNPGGGLLQAVPTR
jgi:hypothetical protein